MTMLTTPLARRFFASLLIFLSASSLPALAWDSTGHRLSASVALRYLDADTRSSLRALLEQHPRYEQDFRSAMPAEIAAAESNVQLDWLLGQAAYWPDIARGFDESERAKYSRPSWHYIDGAWLRGAANTQGNLYVNREPAKAIMGPAAREIRTEADADNVMTALDYNTRVLADSALPASQRAVALCWVLHLMGDVHQPLHSGSLYGTRLFETGDRGGNAIRIGDSNLHARWDQAMRGKENIAQTMKRSAAPGGLTGIESDWSLWLQESRGFLRGAVYSPSLLQAIEDADRSSTRLPAQSLDEAYVNEMTEIASERLGLAGLRLAIWFQNTLPK